MISLIDTHCHINFFQNAGEIALQCEKQKIYTIYVTTLPSQFDETYQYVKDLKYVLPSLGFHSLESQYDITKEKKLFLKHINNTQYIGEVGLDFSKKAQKSKEDQKEIFEFVLENIKDKNKLLSVHSNKAEDVVLDFLLKYNIKNVIFHWYSGKIGTLQEILKQGYCFSVNSAMCTSKKGQNIISKLPKNRVLVETDAPFIKNVLPYDNEEVYDYLSMIWNMKIDMVKKQVLDNFIRLERTEIKTNLFN